MIKKISWKKLPLYWKTWLITTVTIFLTMGIFLVVFTFFASAMIEENQKNKVLKSVDEVENMLKADVLNHNEIFEMEMSELVNFIIYKDEVCVYPENLESVVVSVGEVNGSEMNMEFFYMQQDELPAVMTEELLPSEELEEDMNQAVIKVELNNPNLGVSSFSSKQEGSESFIEKRDVSTQEGEEYQLYAICGISTTKEEAKGIIFSLVPYLLVIGLAVAFAVSFLYARYFSNKIKHLNKKMGAMAMGEWDVPYQNEAGDELQELENDLHQMYGALQLTLQNLNDEMETVKKLETDRQLFMRGATHELKTPIMAMGTALDAMMENGEVNEDHEEHLKACHSRLQSMSKLVNEMLEVSRIEGVLYSGKTNLAEETQKMITIYDYMITDKNIELTLRCAGTMAIDMPKKNLQKVLSNLLGNAVKYTPDNGRIMIEGEQNTWTIRNRIFPASKIDCKKIFEPFFSFESETENEFERSHGLGLYIVNAILQQYQIKYRCFQNEETNEFVFQLLL